MNSIAPSIAKRLNLLRLARDVVSIPVLHVAAGCRPLEVGVESDSVWWVDVNALDLPPQSFPLSQRSHYLHAIAENHTVAPVRVVLVELGLSIVVRQPIEICEEIDLIRGGFLVGLAAAQQVVNQNLRMHLFLDVQRWRM